MSSTEVTGKVERGIEGKRKGERMGSQTPRAKILTAREGVRLRHYGGGALCCVFKGIEAPHLKNSKVNSACTPGS